MRRSVSFGIVTTQFNKSSNNTRVSFAVCEKTNHPKYFKVCLHCWLLTQLFRFIQVHWHRFSCRCPEETNSPVANYMLKGNNRSTRTMCEICSKLTIKLPPCSSVSIVNFEQVNAYWECVEIVNKELAHFPQKGILYFVLCFFITFV